MVVVKSSRYCADLENFFRRHTNSDVPKDFSMCTSKGNGVYHTTYIAQDGAKFSMDIYPVEEMCEVNVHGITMEMPVSLLRHVYWSTDFRGTKCWYEGINGDGVNRE